MSRKLLLGMLLLTGGIVGAALGLTEPKPVYSLSVSQFLKSERYDETVRVSGELVAGSLCREEEPCGYRFRLSDVGTSGQTDGASRPELHVRYDTCIVPDNFRDQRGMPAELVVYGERCRACRDLVATELLVRTAWKYELNRDRARAPSYFVPLCAP